MSHGCENTNPMLIDGCGLVPPTSAEVVRFTRSSSLRKVPEDLSASAWRALMESVDYCPMGNISIRQSGVSPSRQPSFGTWLCGRYPPPEGLISHSMTVLTRPTSVRWTVLWGTQWGQLDGRQDPVQLLLQGPRRLGVLCIPFQ